MDQLLIKITNDKDSFFIKELLGRLAIQFEVVDDNIKSSVIDGQAAYKKGEMGQFKKIDRKDLWK